MKTKPTIALDFDGVLHSYTSGWQGPRTIPDDPVPGALEFLVTALDHFTVAIHSSRSHHLFGRWAMKRWLSIHLYAIALTFEGAPAWWQQRIARSVFAEPSWADELDCTIWGVLREIQWPKYKPAAILSIDDRAMTFRGAWPSIEEIAGFRPWNRGGATA